MHQATIVLAGNPNCGKTVLFNALTGSRQRIGNWPGVTVEKKEGYFQQADTRVAVMDLPGTYSLNVITDESALDERIACEFLLNENYQLIINVIDASNLARNLYLSLQLLELQRPMILAVNMMDVAQRQGMDIDLNLLSELLRCPVIPLVVTKGVGIEDLKDNIVTELKKIQTPHWMLPLPEPLEHAVEKLRDKLHSTHGAQSEWLALRLLEGDRLAELQVGAEFAQLAQQQAQELEQTTGEMTDILMADARYNFINQMIGQVVNELTNVRQSITQRLDKIVLNRILGIPIFFAMMYLMFVFAINVGGAFQDFFDISSDTIFVAAVAHYLTAWHWPDWLVALLANGIGRGINTSITFIPVIGAMFLFLSFLEDSGYMARAAFVMDRLMRALGLPGRAFVPMIVGFGCNVPAVMAARTLSSQRDRVLTVMMMPFMSCGARLAIFAVFASAFFQKGGQNIIFILYITGILVAVLTGFLLRKTVLAGEPATLIMEMPSYHWPKMSSILRHSWQRLKSFLNRATQVIVPVCMLIGVLNSISLNGQLVNENSTDPTLLAVVGQVAVPVFQPMGLREDNWPATVGLLTGILAKEVVVGTLNTLYSQAGHLERYEEEGFSWQPRFQAALSSIKDNLISLTDAIVNPLVASEAPHQMNKAVYGLMAKRFDGKIGAFAYLLFVLLYFPCISTVAAMRREVGGSWALFSMLWSTGLAYVLATFCYQLLTIHRHWYSSLLWIALMSLVMLGAAMSLHRVAMKE